MKSWIRHLAVPILFATSPVVAVAAAAVDAKGAVTVCDEQPAVTLGSLTAKRCTTSTFGNVPASTIEGGYGQVLMDVSGGSDVQVDRNWAKAMRSIFGIRRDFMATVSLALKDGDVLLYEQPLLVVHVAEDGPSTLKVSDVLASDLAISPVFAVRDPRRLSTTLKVSVARKQEGSVVDVLKSGVDAAGALGGQHWLLTAATQEPFLLAAAKAQAAVNAHFTEREDLSSIAHLGFTGDALKKIVYSISFPAPGGQAATTRVTVFLKAWPSLITPDTMAAPDHWVPQTHGGIVPSDRWASHIPLGSKSKDLATYLDNEGVPARLTELQNLTASDRAAARPRRDEVDAACKALKLAFQGTPFRLSESDRDLVLFDELRNGGVFRAFRPSELECLAGVRDLWTTRYKLQVPGTDTTVRFTARQKAQRLDRLASHWAFPAAETRQALLAEEDFTDPVLLTAPPTLVPGSPPGTNTDAATGLATWMLAPQRLGELRKTCLGNQLENADTDDWQTAFATFEGQPDVFLLTAYFHADGEGGSAPKIRALTIKPASDADRTRYNRNGNCLTPRP